MQIVYLIVYVSTSREQGPGHIRFSVLCVKHDAWDMVESQWICVEWRTQRLLEIFSFHLIGSDSKKSACNAGAAGDVNSIPGLERCPGGGHGNPLQYSCLENPMDRGAWWATVHGVTKSQTRLQRLCTHTFGLDALWGVPVSLCTSPSPLHGTLKPRKVSMKQSPCWYGNNDNRLRDQERISSSNSFPSSCCELT